MRARWCPLLFVNACVLSEAPDDPPPGDDTDTVVVDGDTGALDTGRDVPIVDTGAQLGCIELEGASRGYASLQDALDAAPDEGTIRLCDGELTESVEITRPVTLVGRGSERSLLVGSGGTALTIRGSGVTLTDLQISGGVHVEEAVDVLFDGIRITGTDVTALSVTRAEVQVLESLFVGGSPAIAFDDGALEVRDSILQDQTLYAIRVTTGTASFYGGEIRDTVDGNGIDATGGDLLVDGVAFQGVAEDGIVATDASLQVYNTTMVGGTRGIVAVRPTRFEVGAVAVTDASRTGILVRDGIDVDLSRVTIASDPTVVVVPSSHGAWSVDRSASTGLFLEGEDLQVWDTTIVGYAGAGAVLEGLGGSPVADLIDLVLEDNRRVGLWLTGLDTDASNLEATGTTGDTTATAYCADRFRMSWDAAVVVDGGALSWVDGGISATETAGLVAVNAVVGLQNLTLSDNDCADVFMDGGELSSRNSTYEGGSAGPLGGAVVAVDVPIVRSTDDVFRGTDGVGVVSETETISGGDTVLAEVRGPVGLDVHVLGCPDVLLSQPTFTGGGVHVLADDSTVRGNGWVSRSAAGSPVVARNDAVVDVFDLDIDGHGGPAVDCAGSELSFGTLTTTSGTSVSRITNTAVNGVPTSTDVAEVSGESLRTDACYAVVRACDLDQPGGPGIVATEGTLLLSDCTVSDTLGIGITLDGDLDATLTDVTVRDTTDFAMTCAPDVIAACIGTSMWENTGGTQGCSLGCVGSP
jgi:hypothetical protein